MSIVEDYMNAKMITRHSKVSVLEISRAMIDWNISSVAITDEDKRVVGVLTERDMIRGIANGILPEKITAGSLMSAHILSIRNDQPIEEAARIMIKKKIRHLLVEDAYHEVIGIITTTDLARYLKERTRKESSTNVSDQQQHQQSSEFLSEAWELFF
jgi:predicted transcriptional regulator